MNYIFFGTPEFAAIILKKLIDAEIIPSALVCNPDRPIGRHQIITPPPTKELIQKLNKDTGSDVKILQPENKNELKELISMFSSCDFGIVAAYSKIIPDEVINSFRLGVIGVHPSLLPKFRGPSPIQSVILADEKDTGITLFLIDDKIDHGQIIESKAIKIENRNYEKLSVELAGLAGDMLVNILPKFVRGETTASPQDESQATYTNKFTGDDGYISPDELKEAMSGKNRTKAAEIERKICALNPEPGVYTFIDEKRTKLLEAVVSDGKLMLTKIQREGKTPIELN